MQKMKHLFKFLFVNSLLLIIACSSSEEVFIPMDKVSDQGRILSIGEFKPIGFKKKQRI